ncbi:MAG: adenylate/guanylate cyclase domain-containing protein [Dehalococcoidia bacterium]|nr:adenylate/guanylate cyclase domain-containing protein [Dehalococcoidia bacterium]
MEPRIQYAKTSDGVSIAFATYGEGKPLVWSHQPIASHVQLEWQQPTSRAAYSLLATMGMLVRFDTRGVGLSDRDVDDVSLNARVRDLEAVADHLGLNTFVLLGLEDGGLPAIAYAVRHPERVTRLILVNCFARTADVEATPQLRAFRGLADDWEMWSENVGAMVFGYGREEARRYGEFVRACVDPEMAHRFREANIAIDVTDLLSQITAPTLVIRHNGLKWLPMDTTRELASAIPNARLLVIEGLYADNAEQLFRGVADFVGEGEEAAAGTAAPVPSGLVTILFTDIEGSTAITQRLGDAKAREVMREHERITRECLRAHGGSEVKTMGDGFMASFGSATKALECAVAIQRAFEARNASLPAHPVAKGDSPVSEGDSPGRGREALEGRAEPQPSAHASTGSARADRGVSASSAGEAIRVRIGLNAGEPIAEDDPDGRGDLFGTAVIRAARIAAMAQGGEILVANVVRELAEGKGFLFGDRGEVALRGFDDPVRVFEVRWTP